MSQFWIIIFKTMTLWLILFGVYKKVIKKVIAYWKIIVLKET